MNTIYTGLLLGASILLILVTTFSVIRARYQKFTNREFVLRFRNGKLINEGFGGGFFVLPLIDELIVLSTTVQRLEVDTGEVITAENQDVLVNGFVIWRIEEPVKAYQSVSGDSETTVMQEINKTLQRLVESIIRTTVARLSLDQVLRERSIIIEAIMSELVTVVGPMGIKINTVEIQHVDVVDRDLFEDLQETYRQEARLTAEKVKLETDQQLKRTEALTTQDVRAFYAEQEERASIRELEKDQKVLLQQQKLNETEQQRLKVVQSLEKQRETSIAELQQKKLKIEAETRLIEIEFDAKSRKKRQILENIDVEAQKIEKLSQMEAEAVRRKAEAEAFRIETLAAAKKKGMVQEAEGRKAMLIAEAEGLKQKLKAQELIKEPILLQELIDRLPDLAKSMKVGDVNWINLANKDGNYSSPLGIVPENIVQLLSVFKAFGLDVETLLKSDERKDEDSQEHVDEPGGDGKTEEIII